VFFCFVFETLQRSVNVADQRYIGGRREAELGDEPIPLSVKLLLCLTWMIPIILSHSG
jgi:hypothetical protein